MKKCIVLFLLALFLISAAHADTPLGGQASQYNNLAENISAIRTNYLGDAWKDLLLKNPTVSGINTIFTNLNPLFVFFLSRDYSLSLEVLFAFILWLFTLIALKNYLFFSNKWYNAIVALGVVIMFAHMQFFNYVALAFFKFIFYKTSTGWSVAITLLLLVLSIVYLYFNLLIARSIKQAKKKEEERDMKARVEGTEGFIKGVKEGSS